MVTPSQKIILVIGPTSSGKSHYAQRLALQRDGEIINYDSQQFYRGLDIGTGKLSTSERKVPHWLLDILNPGEFMSAGEFTRQAEAILQNFFSRGKTPILVGGTGLYIRSLLEGIDDLPPRDPEIRRRLEAELAEKGTEILHRRLREIDPSQAARISINDRLRVVRFLEIYEISGRKPSQLLKKGRATQLCYSTETHWLSPPRELLRKKIAERIEQMLANGWTDEIQNFLNQKNDPRLWENKPIGYAELAQAMLQEQDISMVVPLIVKKTRAYAKRQETFFRGLLSNSAYQKFGSTLKVLENFGENI
jgi:tRNA dimethylallyltransferase